MKVSDIIEFLSKNFKPEDCISMDFRWYDENLYYDKDLSAVFGTMKDD